MAKQGRPGIPVRIIDTQATRINDAFRVFQSCADAAEAIFGSKDYRSYVSKSTVLNDIDYVAHTNRRFIVQVLYC